MGIKWIEDQLNAEVRQIARTKSITLDEAAKQMMTQQPPLVSLWSPDSGQTWNAEGNENHGVMTLRAFLEANEGEENEDVRRQVLELKPGGMVAFGGGASPYCEVTLLCDCGGFTRDADGRCAGEHAKDCEWRPCPHSAEVSSCTLCSPPQLASRRLEKARSANDRANAELRRWRNRR